MTADQRAVDAAMKALDCEELHDRNGTRYCAIHHAGWLSDVNACVRAEAAVQGPIERAGEVKALRDAAWALDIPNTEPGTRADRIGATGAPDWLRERADRLVAQP